MIFGGLLQTLRRPLDDRVPSQRPSHLGTTGGGAREEITEEKLVRGACEFSPFLIEIFVGRLILLCFGTLSCFK